MLKVTKHKKRLQTQYRKNYTKNSVFSQLHSEMSDETCGYVTYEEDMLQTNKLNGIHAKQNDSEVAF